MANDLSVVAGAETYGAGANQFDILPNSRVNSLITGSASIPSQNTSNNVRINTVYGSTQYNFQLQTNGGNTVWHVTPK